MRLSAAKRKSRTTARSAEAVEAVGGVEAAAFASVMLGWRASEEPSSADGKAPQEAFENQRRGPPSREFPDASFTSPSGAPATGPNEPHLAPPPRIAPLCTYAENLRLSCPVRATRDLFMVIALMTCITPASLAPDRRQLIHTCRRLHSHLQPPIAAAPPPRAGWGGWMSPRRAVVESPRGAIARGAARYYAGRESSAPAAARSEVELESSLDLMEMGGADDLDDDLGA